ncbi:hypothetical protein OG589_14890 [Sphaerisporangium sp. NBC_01403]|uniref:hypothetical protein n=1 Tax=Sphaerisporangium sp. NBC_01403 TaxID=2903599 RepID=UPI003243842D
MAHQVGDPLAYGPAVREGVSGGSSTTGVRVVSVTPASPSTVRADSSSAVSPRPSGIR